MFSFYLTMTGQIQERPLPRSFEARYARAAKVRFPPFVLKGTYPT